MAIGRGSREPCSTLVAGVELGGTKCVAVIARGPDIVQRAQWRTGDDAAATLATIARWLDDAARHHRFAALGVASFGPLRVDPGAADYGRILKTPKPGWSNTNVLAAIAGDFAGPIALDTDVAGAALAEGRWGAATGCPSHLYLTIGTASAAESSSTESGFMARYTLKWATSAYRVRQAIALPAPVHFTAIASKALPPASRLLRAPASRPIRSLPIIRYGIGSPKRLQA